jgi:hypothetical protein
MSLRRRKRPTGKLVIEAIKDAAKLASKATRGRRRTKSVSEWRCSMTSGQVFWLAAAAFEDVLRKKQTAYADVLDWLRGLRMDCDAALRMNGKTKRAVIEGSRRVFEEWKF